MRSAPNRIMLLILLPVLCGPALCAFAEEATRSVLFIGHAPDHPHGSHMYLHTCRLLAECARLNGLQAQVSDGWPAAESPQAAALAQADAIVLYTSPGAELLLGGEHRDAFAERMRAGVGLMTIHWASTVRQDNLDRLGPDWLRYLGGTWISNVGLSTDTSRLVQLSPEHPVCRGWSEYDLHDEFYLNPTIAEAKPLLQVETKGQQVIVGWAYERPDGGRSFATTLGHFYENFQREPFRRALTNAILWTAQAEVPLEGARIDVEESLLALPPAE